MKGTWGYQPWVNSQTPSPDISRAKRTHIQGIRAADVVVCFLNNLFSHNNKLILSAILLVPSFSHEISGLIIAFASFRPSPQV